MGKRWILAAALMLVSSMAFAEHAFTLEPDAATVPASVPAAPPAVAPETVTAPAMVAADATAPAATEPVRQAQTSYPAELDVYLVQAATREVCTTGEWGLDEIRTDCRTEPLAPRRGNPALQGVCTTFYGRRS